MYNIYQNIKISRNDVKDAVIDKPFTIYKPVDSALKMVSSIYTNRDGNNVIYAAIKCKSGSIFSRKIECWYDFEDEYLNRRRDNTEIISVATVLFTTVEVVGGEMFFEITLVMTKK